MATGTGDPRLEQIIQKFDESQKFDVVIVTFPYDEGVRRNGGRVGAANGPQSFLKYAKRLCASDSHLNYDLTRLKIGLIEMPLELTLEDSHVQLEENVFKILLGDAIPFVVGGGNDQSYPNASAFMKFCQHQNLNNIHVVNIDAHLDVRPLKEGKVHSGSPFRLMLEDDRFKKLSGKFTEFACQGPQCALEHVIYAKENNVSLVFLPEIQKDPTLIQVFIVERPTFVSFDIDSIQASDCPGVSCSSPEGLTASQALRICRQSGKSPNVYIMDFSEYNPVIEEYKTGRLLAFMFHEFLCGVYERKFGKQIDH